VKRFLTLLATLLLFTACSQTDTESDPAAVFSAAFPEQSPPSDVAVLHGFRLKSREWGESKHMWRLHLKGPGTKRLIEQRWPDLQPGIRRVFVQGSQTPWFAPGRELKYITFTSAAEPVTVMQAERTDEYFIAYDGL
jgi:hypothetical protein